MAESQQNLTALKRRLLVRAAGSSTNNRNAASSALASSGAAANGDRGYYSDPHANCRGIYREGTLSHWDMRRDVPQPPNAPTWNTKTRPFNPRVMVGNWAEERLKKDYISKQNVWKGNVLKKDPADYDSARSEALQARILNENGASNSYMFKQHDQLYNNNRITIYDENYNQRWQEKNFPKLRRWHLTHMAWLPEKTDHPLFGPPTNFGLFDAKKQKWDREMCDKHRTYYTMYQSKYLSRFPGHFMEKHPDQQQKMNFSYTKHYPRCVC